MKACTLSMLSLFVCIAAGVARAPFTSHICGAIFGLASAAGRGSGFACRRAYSGERSIAKPCTSN